MVEQDIVDPKIEGTSYNEVTQFPVTIQTNRDGYNLDNVAIIKAGASFRVSLNLQNKTLIREQFNLEDEVTQSLSTLVARANTRESGINGMYVEPFLRKHHGVSISIRIDDKVYTKKITSKEIREEFNKIEEREISRHGPDGIIVHS